MAIPMQGDAFTQPGSQHYIYHQYVRNRLWDPYHTDDPTSPYFRSAPTNAEYGQVSHRGLIVAGLPLDQAAEAAAAAAAERAQFPELIDTAKVPRVPGRRRKEYE
jgi:hypothetical protein